LVKMYYILVSRAHEGRARRATPARDRRNAWQPPEERARWSSRDGTRSPSLRGPLAPCLPAWPPPGGQSGPRRRATHGCAGRARAGTSVLEEQASRILGACRAPPFPPRGSRILASPTPFPFPLPLPPSPRLASDPLPGVGTLPPPRRGPARACEAPHPPRFPHPSRDFSASRLTLFLYAFMSVLYSFAASGLAGLSLFGSVSRDWIDVRMEAIVYTGFHLSAMMSRHRDPSGKICGGRRRSGAEFDAGAPLERRGATCEEGGGGGEGCGGRTFGWNISVTYRTRGGLLGYDSGN
jgi:hypothetical protein